MMNSYSKPEFVVFMDRDGTICEEKMYLSNPDDVSLIPGAAKAIRLINERGGLAIVITNQAGIARGILSESVLVEIHDRMKMLLSREQAQINAIYYCPHHKDAKNPLYRVECKCRKPEKGMFEKASKDFDIADARYYMVGDKNIDIQWGKNIGAFSIVVLTGYGEEELKKSKAECQNQPDFAAKDLHEAVVHIMKREAREQV